MAVSDLEPLFLFFFTIINLLTVAVYTLTHTHYNNIVIVIFDAELVSEHHANHM